jgi:putative PIG3 family NAD(P)H quinone oxidoreductase
MLEIGVRGWAVSVKPGATPALTRRPARGERSGMHAILVREPGDENMLTWGEAPAPALGAADLRIRVRATAVNRADLLQRQGLYPPPPGASPILGLECAGEVLEVGPEARGFTPGQRVMALLAGGGYAEEIVTPAATALAVPNTMSDEEAGAFPEVFFTAFSNLFMPGLGALAAGESALVHGGGGGVGTAAINLLREASQRCFVTAGSDEKCRRCVELGATAAINYRTEDFSTRARELAGGRGVNVILDHIGARYLAGNLAALAVGGRLVLIGLMGGAHGELSLADLLIRRLAVIGSTLRSRSVEEKGRLVAAFRDRFGNALAAGRLRPVIDRVLPITKAAEAHRLMQASEHFGKIVLRVP